MSFEDVSFVYPDAGDYAIHDLSLEIGRGQTLGIIGGTGCGKSTMINLIPRFYEVSKGCVKVDGTECAGFSGASAAKENRYGAAKGGAVFWYAQKEHAVA